MSCTGTGCCGSSNEECFADDDIVITGISGRFPQADNMEELKENLFSKQNCVMNVEDRWCSGSQNSFVATMKSLNKFDHEFFNMNIKGANTADPQLRIMFEVSYEAIIDSGYSTAELSGKQVGVFVGQSDAEAASNLSYSGEFASKGSTFTAYHVACLISNKLSHRYNFTGPSVAIDCSCSSSGICLEDAFRRLKDGTIEAALVGGCSMSINPMKYQAYQHKQLISPTAKSCPYDTRANGFVKGEAIVAIFLQKKKDARRIYSKIHNVECICAGDEVEGNLIPSSKGQSDLIKSTYKVIGMNPSVIDYLEGHGVSVPSGDEAEIKSVDEVFCKDRKTPLLLGSVKANIGHTEASSALCSIAKVILAFEMGVIAPSLNYCTPNPKCLSLTNGKITFVTEATAYDKLLAAVNNFSFSGTVFHIILERNRKQSLSDKENSDRIPELVIYSATTEEALVDMFKRLHKVPLERGFFALLNKSAYVSPLFTPFRGFTIIKKNSPQMITVEHCPPIKRQVWYIVTGMGCQWPGMGLDLMQLDVFAESMKKSAKILERFGIDLLELLKPDRDYLQQDRHITPAFVTIAAIQIALVDVLNALGLKPDYIIGHSTGELVCSYADGCCTAEQTILSAYYRGASVECTDLPLGEMAAVGLTWEEAKKRCPEGVFPACHNGEDSVTLSGSKEALEKFVEQLKSENIFARIVNAYGYAFHCNTISAVTETLRRNLQTVYTDPKPRSKRWLSTSYLEHEWNELRCQIADANYFCHNLESQVHFREVLHYIPPDAITIEIGPHFLLQSILKRTIGNKASYIGLMKRNSDNVDFLLSSIGKLYILGLDPELENLYQPVSYPVARGTPMISPFIQWNHSNSFYVPWHTELTPGKSNFHVRTTAGDNFLLDHCIDGRSLYPAAGYIYLVWQAFAASMRRPIETVSVCIEDFKIFRATILNSENDKHFEVGILNKRGDFEILENGSIVSTGRVFKTEIPMFRDVHHCYKRNKSSAFVSGSQLYSELRIHGYEYGPAFQSLLELSVEGTDGLVKWNNEWISFLDSLLLFFGIIYESNDFKLPVGARSIKIDPIVFMEFVERMKEEDPKAEIPVNYNQQIRTCTTPGVEIWDLKLEPAPHRALTEIVPVLEDYSFVPYHQQLTHTNEQISRCDSYVEVCCCLASQVMNNLKMNHVDDLMHSIVESVSLGKTANYEEFKSCEEENYPLLNTIKNILQMSTSRKLHTNIEEECRNKIFYILGEDLLFKVMLNENPLRSLLDIALENCFGRITVTEWCGNNPILIPSVQDVMKCFSSQKANFVLIHSQAVIVDAKEMNQRNISTNVVENNAIPGNLIGSSMLGISCIIPGGKESLHSQIQRVASLTKEGGFVLIFHKHQLSPPELFVQLMSKLSFIIHSEAEIEQLISSENMLMVSKTSIPFGVNAYLLRKVSPRVQPFPTHVINVRNEEYDLWVEDLKRAMVTIQDKDISGVLLLVAQDTPLNGIIGMVNCLKQEPGGDKIRCIFTDSSAPPFERRNNLYADMLKKDLLMNVYINGSWGSFRHLSLASKEPLELMDCAHIECTKLGDLSSFRWIESPLKYGWLDNDAKDLYHVYFSSLNFRDVMLATGKLSLSTVKDNYLKNDVNPFGVEFSGRDKNGRRFTAMADHGGLCKTYFQRPRMILEVPDKWSLEEAATIPVAYATCYYSLIIRGELQQGEKVLIHSGTGGVGQAAIRIALSMECEIFTTVGTPDKKKFLLETFPQLNPENIGSSRDTSFEEMIMTRTKGEGVDVVLNSLADDKFQASVRCLRYYGRFLEIGKYDLSLNNTLGLQVFLKGISFYGIQIDTYFTENVESSDFVHKLHKCMTEGIQNDVVQPLNRTVFPIDEAENAFRYMGSGKHIGKVLLKVRDEEPEKILIPLQKKVTAYRNIHFYRRKSYIIIGGLGGFGIELAKWLTEKGAGTVVLTTRHGARTPYHHLCLKRWKESGARVHVSTLNVVKWDEAKRLILDTSTMYGPIGGIFNSAVVLKDAFIENQNASDFKEVCAPKAVATRHLDKLAREMCPQLDMFVCFSSISCGKGNAGQTNYGYANSVMERICEQRRKDGLHGLAVQWGIIGDVGLVHRHMGEDAMIAGVMAQKIKSCLQCLEKLLLQERPVVSSFVIADKSRMKTKSDDVLAHLARLLNVPDVDQINPYRTFRDMGIDSVLGVELRQLLESSFDVTFTLQEMQDMKIDDVKKLVEEKKKKMISVEAKSMKSIDINITSALLATHGVTAMNIVNKGTPVFIIYVHDVLPETLKKLCQNIVHPVFLLQCTKDTPTTSVKDMCMWYLKQIQKSCLVSSVHLVSVSTAANLTLEMTLLAEMQNSMQCADIKSLTIIDGSLDLMETYGSTEQEKMKNEATYEADDLCKFLSAFSDSDLSQLKTRLEHLPTSGSRIRTITSLLTTGDKVAFAEAAELYIKRQRLMRFHILSGKLQKNLTVIEAAEKVLPNDLSAIKSFMAQICNGHVTIHRVLTNNELLVGDSSSMEVATLLNELYEKIC